MNSFSKSIDDKDNSGTLGACYIPLLSSYAASLGMAVKTQESCTIMEDQPGTTQIMKAAVIGAAGYAGIELVRYLLGHPGFELVAATSNGDAGRPLAQLYPALLGRTGLAFTTHESVVDAGAPCCDVAFLAVPHTAALAMAPALLRRGCTVIDLSADFRLTSPAVYEQWYGTPHTEPGLLAHAVYGLPELNRAQLAALAMQDADKPVLVASPGCYPTASALAAAPAFAAGLVDAEAPVVINAISGVSGAGRTPTMGTQYCGANEDVHAYAATTHRHTPEIEQTLSRVAGMPVTVSFTPHLAPLTRGLVATATLRLAAGATLQGVERAYAQAYGDEPFVRVLPTGAMPQTSAVAGTNKAQVGIALDARAGVLVASCAIDNLGKGASAQAIQSANIVYGFDETSGLEHALAPLV